MPCYTHNHAPWPTSGVQVLRIEACETICGWCQEERKPANNLRTHARRHIKNPEDRNLWGITIATGKTGRSRISASRRRRLVQDVAAPQHSHTHTPSDDSRAARVDEVTIASCGPSCPFNEERKRTTMLEEILRDKGFNVEAELAAKSRQGNISSEIEATSPGGAVYVPPPTSTGMTLAPVLTAPVDPAPGINLLWQRPHSSSEHSQPIEFYECDVSGCPVIGNKGFRQLEDLRHHQWAAHALLKSGYRCPYCTGELSKFRMKSSFRPHVEVIHKRSLREDEDLSKYYFEEPYSPPVVRPETIILP